MKVAAKLLRHSDLTLFRSQYERLHETTKQKAINLNADVFVGEFYPGLRGQLTRYSVTLQVSGPGNRGPLPHASTGTVLKQQKNWRLDGRLIEDPLGEPERFVGLEEGDIALLAFEGDVEPEAVSIHLVSSVQDNGLHQALMTMCKFSLESRESMRSLSTDAMEDLHARGLLSDTLALFIPDAIEDVLFGVGEGDELGLGPLIDQDALAKRGSEATKVGRMGEEAFEAWLLSKDFAPEDYRWVSDTHAQAAFDFKVERPVWDGMECPALIDVKSTRGSFDRAFHVSRAEVELAARTDSYLIARISSLADGSCRVTILGGLPGLAQQILAVSVQPCPAGVSPNSYAVSPTLLEQLVTEDFVWLEPAGG